MSSMMPIPGLHESAHFPRIDTLPHLLYGTALVLLIAFIDLVPPNLGRYVDTALGRVLGIALIFVVLQTMGWTYGILTALAFLLLVHLRPSNAVDTVDGFENLEERQAIGTRWFVEKVLGECPDKIVNETASTTAVQDLSEKSMSRGR